MVFRSKTGIGAVGGLAVAWTCAVFAGGEVVYQNDFSTRTSSVGVPSPRWMSQAYVDGDLLRGGGTDTFGEGVYQDAWYVGRDGNLSGEAWVVCRPFSNDNSPVSANTYNRCAIFIGSNQKVEDTSKDHRTHIFQSIGNVLTNGILRMQVDMHAAEYNCTANNNFFVGPLYKKYLNPAWGASLPKYAGFFGFNLDGGAQAVKTYYYGGNGKGGVAASPVYDGHYKSQVIIGNWYRFVIDYNLDANTFGGTVYAMGSTQPELTTPNGQQMDTFSSVHFYSDLSDDTGGIAGIVVRDCGSVSTARKTDASHAPAFDNVRLWWRASGTAFTDADLFYENDFAVRRSRALEPTPPTTATFVTVQTTVDDSFTGYSVNEINNLPGNLLLATATGYKAVQAYGIDGWRRINGGSLTEYSVARYTKGVTNKVIAVTAKSGTSNRYGLCAQNLGGKITKGQVRLQFDTRTPDKMRATDTPFIYGMLAPEDYLNSGTDDPQARLYAARSGFLGANDSSTFKFATMGGSGSSATTWSTDGAASSHWYRVFQTVDLGTKTFDTEIYDLGTLPVPWNFTVTDAPVFTRTGDACRNGSLADIACFAFFVGGAGGETEGSTPVANNEAGIVYLDNIRVWKRATAQDDWTKVYYNDLDTRVRYNMPKTSYALASLPDVPGTDGWVMRNRTEGKPTIFGSANPALAMDNASEGAYLWAVQPIGDEITHGRIRFRADFRPPREWVTWHGTTSTGGSLMLGTDAMYTGNRYSTAYLPDFLTQFQIRFGVAPESYDKRHNRYADSKPFYYNTNGTKTFFTNKVEWTHWYRFESVSDVRKGTFDLKVYDMGTTHPDLATPTPNVPLAQVANAPFRTSLAVGEGLSSICASIIGNVKETPWKDVDDGLCYIDNIQFTRMPSGSIFLVR